MALTRELPAPADHHDVAAALAPAGSPSPTVPTKPSAARLLPGLLVCLAVGLGGLLVNRMLPGLSPLLVAIVAGVLVANTVPVPKSWDAGVAVASKKLLRVGIVLLGLQLSLQDITGLGFGAVSIAVAVVAIGLVSTLFIGKWLGIPKTQRLLIACGFSICGAAAVGAADSVIDADPEETASAVGLVVLFGTISIPLVPILGALVGLSDHWRAVAVGASIHEVAQVVASAGLVGGSALAVAVVVKLTRVLLLAPVMAGVSIWARRQPGASTGRRPAIIPLFVLGFIAAIVLRTLVSIPPEALDAARTGQSFLLATAMFALGLGVRLRAMRGRGLGLLVLGALSTLVVYGVAIGGALAWS